MNVLIDEKQRLDKWLFFARVFKTRNLAANMICAGRIRVNREKVIKPSFLIKIGDVLTVRLDKHVLVYKIEAIGYRRGPASEACVLYQDLTVHNLPDLGSVISSTGSRPTKRERRRYQLVLDRQL